MDGFIISNLKFETKKYKVSELQLLPETSTDPSKYCSLLRLVTNEGLENALMSVKDGWLSQYGISIAKFLVPASMEKEMRVFDGAHRVTQYKKFDKEYKNADKNGKEALKKKYHLDIDENDNVMIQCHEYGDDISPEVARYLQNRGNDAFGKRDSPAVKILQTMINNVFTTISDKEFMMSESFVNLLGDENDKKGIRGLPKKMQKKLIDLKRSWVCLQRDTSPDKYVRDAVATSLILAMCGVSRVIQDGVEDLYNLKGDNPKIAMGLIMWVKMSLWLRNIYKFLIKSNFKIGHPCMPQSPRGQLNETDEILMLLVQGVFLRQKSYFPELDAGTLNKLLDDGFDWNTESIHKFDYLYSLKRGKTGEDEDSAAGEEKVPKKKKSSDDAKNQNQFYMNMVISCQDGAFSIDQASIPNLSKSNTSLQGKQKIGESFEKASQAIGKMLTSSSHNDTNVGRACTISIDMLSVICSDMQQNQREWPCGNVPQFNLVMSDKDWVNFKQFLDTRAKQLTTIHHDQNNQFQSMLLEGTQTTADTEDPVNIEIPVQHSEYTEEL